MTKASESLILDSWTAGMMMWDPICHKATRISSISSLWMNTFAQTREEFPISSYLTASEAIEYGINCTSESSSVNVWVSIHVNIATVKSFGRITASWNAIEYIVINPGRQAEWQSRSMNDSEAVPASKISNVLYVVDVQVDGGELGNDIDSPPRPRVSVLDP